MPNPPVPQSLESGANLASNVTLRDVHEMAEKLARTRELVLEQEAQYAQMSREVVTSLNGPATKDKKRLNAVVGFVEHLLSLVLGVVLLGAFLGLANAGLTKDEAFLSFLAYAAAAVLLLTGHELLKSRIISPFRVRHGIGRFPDFESVALQASKKLVT